MNSKLIQWIKDECTAIDTESQFDAMLDDSYDFSKVGGPFADMSPSRVLKEVDPVAHRCGLNDWEDGESRNGDWVTVDNGDTYYSREDCEKVRDELADLGEGLTEQEREEIRSEDFES